MLAPGTSSNSSTSSESRRRHASRKAQARIQLVGILILLVSAFVLLFSFAFNKDHNHWRVLIGLLFGSSVACSLLFVAIWQRQNWARYILIVALLVLSAIFGLCLILLLTDPTEVGSPAISMLGFGIGGLALASGWLIFSKRVRYLTTPPGSGG